MDQNTPTPEDFTERAIPTIPGQRQHSPADDWTAAAALMRFPRPPHTGTDTH